MVLEKDQNQSERSFSKLIKHDRETKYYGMKSNVERYGLKPFYTNYEDLDTFHYNIEFENVGSTLPLKNFLIPDNLIEEGKNRYNFNFSLTNITGDGRFLNLLPDRNTPYLITGNYYKDFSNFELRDKDFVVRQGFEDNDYIYNDAEISKYFTLHVIHEPEDRYYFDFLNMFKYAKNRGLGQKFEQVFYSYLHENDTTAFTAKEKYDAGKKEFILYIVFLDGTYEPRFTPFTRPLDIWHSSTKVRVRVRFLKSFTSQKRHAFTDSLVIIIPIA